MAVTLSLLEKNATMVLQLLEERQNLIAQEEKEVGRLEEVLKKNIHHLQGLVEQEQKVMASYAERISGLERGRDKLTEMMEKTKKLIPRMKNEIPRLEKLLAVSDNVNAILARQNPEVANRFNLSTP